MRTVIYSLEWMAPAGMERAGIRRDTLKAGDRLILTGNPHRQIAENGVVRLRSAQRPADGWKWAPGPR
jgi:hypothetical protein